MLDLAVIILTKNEELHIARCLERLMPLEPKEIFVVDSVSTDRTLSIIEDFRRKNRNGWFYSKAKAVVDGWLAGMDEERFASALDALLEEKLANGEYRCKNPCEKSAMREGALRFYREFSAKIIPLSDGRCVYFTPDCRAKARNADNARSWAEYAIHAVTNGGQRLAGKTYNERWFNKRKADEFGLLPSVLKQEHCAVRLVGHNPALDSVAFFGEDAEKSHFSIVTRLDAFGNALANLTEVTFVASGKRQKKSPRLMPLAEAVGTVVHHQIAAGSNPPTADIIPQTASACKGETTKIEVVEHPWPGLYAKQFNWALENAPITAKWVLRLDADEYLYPDAIEEVKSLLPKVGGDGNLPQQVTSLSLSLARVFCGRRIRFGGTAHIPMIRFFKYGIGRCQDRAMDEHIILDSGEDLRLKGEFADDNLNNMDWWREKHRGYAKREAVDALAGEKFKKSKTLYYRFPPYLRAFLYFSVRYFLLLGFLDGYAGWMWHFWQGLWYRCLVDREIGKLKRKK